MTRRRAARVENMQRLKAAPIGTRHATLSRSGHIGSVHARYRTPEPNTVPVPRGERLLPLRCLAEPVCRINAGRRRMGVIGNQRVCARTFFIRLRMDYVPSMLGRA